MPWTVHVNSEFGYIQTVYRGVITVKEVKESTSEALAHAADDRPHLFLTDVVEADSALSAVDICAIPNQWTELKAHPANKLALLVPAQGKMWYDAQFYEDVCVNRGWNVKVFTQRSAAINWLIGEETAE